MICWLVRSSLVPFIVSQQHINKVGWKEKRGGTDANLYNVWQQSWRVKMETFLLAFHDWLICQFFLMSNRSLLHIVSFVKKARESSFTITYDIKKAGNPYIEKQEPANVWQFFARKRTTEAIHPMRRTVDRLVVAALHVAGKKPSFVPPVVGSVVRF